MSEEHVEIPVVHHEDGSFVVLDPGSLFPIFRAARSAMDESCVLIWGEPDTMIPIEAGTLIAQNLTDLIEKITNEAVDSLGDSL